MTTLAIQYLESDVGNSKDIQKKVRMKLRSVLEMMPISLVLIGWKASEPLVHICREEVDKAGAKMFRWHPLLAGDGVFIPRSEWQTVGLGGECVPGLHNMPDFTFVCPNRLAVRAAIMSRLEGVLRTGYYDGIFLDRMRYPSPAPNPARWISCFCEDCREAAEAIGVDLESVKSAFQNSLNTATRTRNLLELLVHPVLKDFQDRDLSLVSQFLQFRMSSITNIVSLAANLVHNEELEVGLDAFSPVLTRLVGQDLEALDDFCEWIKVMTYGHTYGPAGLIFEILDLAKWLMNSSGVGAKETLGLLSSVLQRPLPESMDAMRQHGLETRVLQLEIELGRRSGVSCLLAGMELVDLAGVTNLTTRQIQRDLLAFHEAGADGLVLSWDLWLMPLERLRLVASELDKIW